MTHYNAPPPRPSGFVRGEDGILEWHGSARYSDPKEAVKTWWRDKMRLGCTEPLSGPGYYGGPCGNTAKHDPDANGRPTKCGVHSAAAVEKRKEKQDATMRKWRAQWGAADRLRDAQLGLEAALHKIADGDNDPRTTAREAITALDEARIAAKDAQK
jgi:hypothetical protein